MENMRKYLSDIDEDKLKVVMRVKNAYSEGRMSLEDAKKELKEKVKTLRPYEIAIAEQDHREFEDEICHKEDIQQMMELFEDIMDDSQPDLPLDHPIMCYYRENNAFRKVLKEIEDLVQYPVIKNQWYEIYDKLACYRTHLQRKQMQLYSMLEKKGFDRPTTTMWLLDDFIRDEISDVRRLLDEDKDEEFISKQQMIIDDILDLMSKEESILYPTSLAMISPEEFEEMKSGDREIGFALIDVQNSENKSSKPVQQAFDAASGGDSLSFAQDLAKLLSRHGYQSDDNKILDVATGKLTLEQINLIYKHMPVDLAYVDENELVKFYTDTNHRVFPRSKNVIGRDVKNCHPKTSVHIVEEIIEKFRSGKESFTEFWINKPDLFIYICYVAVRDENGKFKGVLEMMQDCTHIRSLTDSRTLLTWEAANADADYGADGNSGKNKEENNKEKGEENMSGNGKDIKLELGTKLSDLLLAYPWLKDELPKINSKFELLNSPLARVMIPKATIEMMADRGDMKVEDLINAIQAKIDEKK